MSVPRRPSACAVLLVTACGGRSGGTTLSGPLAFPSNDFYVRMNAGIPQVPNSGVGPTPGFWTLYLSDDSFAGAACELSDDAPVVGAWLQLSVFSEGGDVFPGTWPIGAGSASDAGYATLAYWSGDAGSASGVGGSVTVTIAGVAKGGAVIGAFASTVLGQPLSGTFDAPFCTE